MDQILPRWKSDLEGLIKVNVDGTFLEDIPRLRVGGVVCGHDGSWIVGFIHFENGSDALMADIRAIQLVIATCYNLGCTNILCESDCLETVNLIHNLKNASLHVYALLPEITDALHHETVNLVHILREHNICANFMAKETSYSAYSAHWTRPPAGIESLLLKDNLAS